MKDYSFNINSKNIFNQPINNDTKTNENISKIATGQGNDYKTGSILDCSYFKESCKMIAIDLNKQQALDADPRAINKLIPLQIQIEQQI